MNKLDGLREHLLYDGPTPAMFRDRKSAREHIKSKYGYILRRPDLRAEPHGWMLPVAVRVEVRVKPNASGQMAARDKLRLDAAMKFIGQRSFRDMIAQRRAAECAQESVRVKKHHRRKKLERHGLSARRGKGFDSSKVTPGSTPGSSTSSPTTPRQNVENQATLTRPAGTERPALTET